MKGGAAIVLSGIQVGTVRNVILFMRNDTPNVRVEMVIKDKYKEFIRTSTYASIGQQGSVGDKNFRTSIW
ncbi:MAG: MCE family protein [Saprospiraceae bacterium]|nr:MCE family protein [Saprospiraceae bacterium]